MSVHFTEQNLSGMLGDLLRQRTASAKDLARRADLDVRAAEAYRAGRHLPPLPAFVRIVRALGHDVWEIVAHPEAAALRLEQEVRDLEAQLATRRAALRDVAGALPLPAEAGPPSTDRSAS